MSHEDVSWSGQAVIERLIWFVLLPIAFAVFVLATYHPEADEGHRKVSTTTATSVMVGP